MGDFGLATTLGERSGVTMTGELVGTPSYLAPETVAGVAEPGPAVDVYGVGAVLYECLTGRPPFLGSNVALTLVQVQHADPTPPRALNPEVPRDLETVCLACLRKEPARRYPTAAAVADDLAAYLAGRPIAARPVGRVEAAVKWARRNRAVAALSAAVFVALVAGTGVSSYYAVEAGERARSETKAADAARDAQAAEALAADKERDAARDARTAEGQARTAEGQARTAEGAALRAKRDSDMLAARLRFDEAVRLAEGGAVAAGLFGLADALRLAPADPAADPFRTAVRLSFAAWGRQLPVLRYVAATTAPNTQRSPWVHPLGPDGAEFLTWAAGEPLRVWDTATGKPTGAEWNTGAEVPIAADPAAPHVLVQAIDGDGWVIRLRDAHTGAQVGKDCPVPRLDPQPAGPHRHSLVAGSRVALSGGFDLPPWNGPRRAWNLDAGTPFPLTLGDHNAPSFRVVPDRDGKPLAVVVRHYEEGPKGPDWRAEFHDLTTGAARSFPVRLGGADPHVSPDGRVFLSVSGDSSGTPGDGSVRWWEAASGRLLDRWQARRPAWYSALAPDGQTLVALGGDDRLRLFDLDTGHQRGGDIGVGGRVTMWDEGGAYPAAPIPLALSHAGELRAWETRHLERQATLAASPRLRAGPPGQTARRYGFVTLSPSGRFAVFGEYQASDYARLVDTHTGLRVGPPVRQELLAHVAFTPDERVMISAPDNYRVGGAASLLFTDTGTGRLRVPPVPLPTYVHGITAGPDGKTVALGRTGGVSLVDFTTGKAWRLVEPSCGWSVAYSPDGKTMAVGYRGGWPGSGAGLRLWDAAGRTPLSDFQPHGEGNDKPQVWFVDGGRAVLAFGLLSQPIRLYDAATGQPRDTPPLPGRVAVLTPRAADTVVALGYSNGTVTQWDVAAGRAVGVPMPHDHPVIGVEYSPDGRLLAVATSDHAVRLWDAATGLPIGPPLLHVADARALRFADGGRTLVTATAAGEVRRWPLPEAAPADPAVLELWVQAASGRLPGGAEVRLLAGADWEARCADLAGRWPAAAAALTKLRTTPAADADWHDRRARDAEATGNAFAAAWHLDRLTKLRPTDWRAHARRGDYAAVGDGDLDATAREHAPPGAVSAWAAHRRPPP